MSTTAPAGVGLGSRRSRFDGRQRLHSPPPPLPSKTTVMEEQALIEFEAKILRHRPNQSSPAVGAFRGELFGSNAAKNVVDGVGGYLLLPDR